MREYPQPDQRKEFDKMLLEPLPKATPRMLGKKTKPTQRQLDDEAASFDAAFAALGGL